MQKIGVLGLGVIGAGIVQLFAEKGYEVIAIDRSEEAIDKGILLILKNLGKSIQEGRITQEEREKIINKINVSINIKNTADCDLIIEAINQNIDAKKTLFTQMDKYCKPETIFATNTTPIGITKIAELTSRPDKVIGMHFFNPVPVINQIQIIKGSKTSEKTKFRIVELAEKIGKLPIEVDDLSEILA